MNGKSGILRMTLGLVMTLLIVGGVYFVSMAVELFGQERDPGEITGGALPSVLVQARQAEQQAIARGMQAGIDKQILFGDLHVHTTNSTDAFLWSLPIYGGEGAHPLADACDFARHCSAIDFWAITDHAEASTPKRWQDAKQSIRACNALADGAEDPDLVSFVGFEWTQVGQTPSEHYGHKNVIFRDLEDAKIAKRPIASGGVTVQALRTRGKDLVPLALPVLDFSNRKEYFDIRRFLQNAADTQLCDPDTRTENLPASCFEVAETPAKLFASLDAQGVDPLVIPHGTTWGFYTPTGTTFDKHLKAENQPESYRLLEIMSGHGNSEEYRDWRSIIPNADGVSATCPSPRPDYLPMCWRAGEIIRDRCLAAGEDGPTCDARAAAARLNAANNSVAAHLTVPGTKIEEWLDAGQCRDCFLPAFGYRPGGSAQYAMALGNFDNPDAPTRFKWGFIASSDNHRARPGTGYKPVDRLRQTDAARLSAQWRQRIFPKGEPAAETRVLDPAALMNMGFAATEMERQASFWTTGGLAAVHSEGRSRDAIFDALERRETYGTSGPRILLWFNTVDGTPMGGSVKTDIASVFEVKAVGAHKQKPGCPEDTLDLLGAERMQKLCANECYNPDDQRLRISRIEIIRIRPQISPDEKVEGLIDDPWMVHECSADEEGCAFTFSDPAFSQDARMATYYARAIQEPTERINADNLRCTYDADGNCVKLDICYGDDRIAADDACKRSVEERAWSSPIFVEYQN